MKIMKSRFGEKRMQRWSEKDEEFKYSVTLCLVHSNNIMIMTRTEYESISDMNYWQKAKWIYNRINVDFKRFHLFLLGANVVGQFLMTFFFAFQPTHVIWNICIEYFISLLQFFSVFFAPFSIVLLSSFLSILFSKLNIVML